MAARITEVRDAVYDLVDNAWVSRSGPDDLVVKASRLDIRARDHAGRKVYVFRSAVLGVPVSREHDQDDYEIGLLVVEKPTDAGDPDEAWVDQRVEFCQWLLDTVGNAREVRLLPASASGGLWPQAAQIDVVCDVEELSERKLFVSLLTVTYREFAAA